MAKILLVEDDNNLREIYGARLLAEGHDIVSAKDGEEALAISVKEKPDLIISDVMMPRISGFDMLDIMRNNPETKDTKVIMMTALSHAEDKARADKLGADRYLVKSQVTLEDVVKTVNDVLNPDSGTKDDQAADSSDSTFASALPLAPSPAPETPQPTPQPPEPETPEAPPAPDEPTTAETDKVGNSGIIPKPLTSKPAEPAAPTEPEKSSEDSVAGNDQPNKKIDVVDSTSSTPAAAVPVPVSTPIQVVLPDDDTDAKNPEDNEAEKPKLNSPSAAPANIGPNLAQALADEENLVDEKIKKFEISGPAPPPAPALPDNADATSAPELKTAPSPQATSASSLSSADGSGTNSGSDDDNKPTDDVSDDQDQATTPNADSSEPAASSESGSDPDSEAHKKK